MEANEALRTLPAPRSTSDPSASRTSIPEDCACSWAFPSVDLDVANLARGVGREAQRTAVGDGQREIAMVRSHMDWPAVDAPDDVKALGKKLIAVLEDHDAAVMGPAIAVVFGYTILELADR